MNTFEDIKLILYHEPDMRYRITRHILDSAGSKGIDMQTYTDEIDLSRKIESVKSVFSSKEVLILKEFMGRKFQKCPGSPNVICCNYYLLNTCFNCLFNCTYCFLNSYLNSFGVVQFVNLEDLPELIKDHCKSHEGVVRIGTGEFTDSLMFDESTSIAEELIRGAASVPRLFLEFKTKSANITHLENIREKGNSVIAWSINTQKNIDLYEEGAAGLEERLDAAVKAQRLGYYTAFHFDPIIKYENFIEEYHEVIDMMSGKLDPAGVVWISMGCFRYSPGFKEIIKNTFPEERLTLEEMFPGVDGKYRYLTPERIEIFKSLKMKLESCFPGAFLYLCMEDSLVWERVFGRIYTCSEELEKDFSDHLVRNFLK